MVGVLDKDLTIDDLGDVYEDLFDAREKWYNSGLHLKLQVYTLHTLLCLFALSSVVLLHH